MYTSMTDFNVNIQLITSAYVFFSLIVFTVQQVIFAYILILRIPRFVINS